MWIIIYLFSYIDFEGRLESKKCPAFMKNS